MDEILDRLKKLIIECEISIHRLHQEAEKARDREALGIEGHEMCDFNDAENWEGIKSQSSWYSGRVYENHLYLTELQILEYNIEKIKEEENLRRKNESTTNN